MIHKTIAVIADYLDASVVGCANTAKMIQGVSIDSRSIQKDALYIPMIGARVDGHAFIEDVIEKGAVAALWQKDHQPYPDFPLILVDDTKTALQQLARAYMKSLHCTVIGVTGSNGKTSCKDMLYSVFSTSKKTQCTQGNHNNEIGLPLTILDFNEDIEIAILEMGMENFNELNFLCSIVQPDISIITTIGSAHMENLGSKLGIARAKCEILENTKPNGLFIYNAESKEIDTVLKEIHWDPTVKIRSFGKGGDIFITSEVKHTKKGVTFSCSAFQEPVQLNVLGTFQAMNALPVIYVARYENISESDIVYGLRHIHMTKMRSQRLEIGKAIVIDDTYKSNPESAKVAIDTLMSIPGQTHIAILGDMLDLGVQEHQLHRLVGEYAKQKGVDKVFCFGPLSKDTAAAAQPKSLWFASKSELVKAVRPYLNSDSVMVVKGSRAMQMDEVVKALQGDRKDE